MTFRAGLGDDDGGFFGHTSAVPVLWGEVDHRGRGDWAIMRLEVCVGKLDRIGWAENTELTQRQLAYRKHPLLAVGYSHLHARTDLSISFGRARGEDLETEMLEIDASQAKGDSGGGVFCSEEDIIKLCGLLTLERRDRRHPGEEIDHWSPERSNLAQSTSDILNRPEVTDLLDPDKRAFGQPNPATERLKLPLPTLPRQQEKPDG